MFENCSCVADSGTAESGICATECHTLPLFLVLVGIVLFLVFMLKIPTVIITLRCIYTVLHVVKHIHMLISPPEGNEC